MLPAQDGDPLKEELQAILLNEYDAEFAVKTQEEAKINSKALAALKVHEKRLSKPSPTQYYTSKRKKNKFQVVDCMGELVRRIYIKLIKAHLHCMV